VKNLKKEERKMEVKERIEENLRRATWFIINWLMNGEKELLSEVQPEETTLKVLKIKTEPETVKVKFKVETRGYFEFEIVEHFIAELFPITEMNIDEEYGTIEIIIDKKEVKNKKIKTTLELLQKLEIHKLIKQYAGEM
jgi:hypothetical protein